MSRVHRDRPDLTADEAEALQYVEPDVAPSLHVALENCSRCCDPIFAPPGTLAGAICTSCLIDRHL